MASWPASIYRLTPPTQASDSILPSGVWTAFDEEAPPFEVAELGFISVGESAGLDWTVIILNNRLKSS